MTGVKSLKPLEFLQENIFLKFIALGLGILVWFIAAKPDRRDENRAVQFSVYYSLFNLPASVSITKRSSEFVTMTLDIGNLDVEDISPERVHARLNMEKALPGKYTLRISEEDIEIPEGTRITYLTPKEIHFEIEKNISKELPILVALEGEPAKGFALGQVAVAPPTITVFGMESVVKRLKSINTSSVNVEGRRSAFKASISPIIPDKVSLPEAEQAQVFEVVIPLSSVPGKKRIVDIPIALIGQEYVTRINPKTFNVLLTGPKSDLEDLSSDDLQASVDLSPYRPGTYKIAAPNIALPSGVRVSKSWPPIDIWVLNQKIYED